MNDCLSRLLIIDGHEDIAWNMLEFGRDYTQSALDIRKKEAEKKSQEHSGICMLGKPEWIKGRVALVFATLFAPPGTHCFGFNPNFVYSNREEAHQLYLNNLETYLYLTNNYPDTFRLITKRLDLKNHLDTWLNNKENPAIGLVLLMEGAEGIRHPREVEYWHEKGLRIVGPSWSRTRYGGSSSDAGPLTQEGIQLLNEMQKLGMGLDLTHLSAEAAKQALNHYNGIIIASHSNAQALLPHSPESARHLTDDIIRGIVEHNGVIGVVPFNRFLNDAWGMGDPKETVAFEEIIKQIDYICNLVGNALHIGIGSDFDGMFGSESVPSGIETVADLRKIGDALLSRGYSEQDIEAIFSGNWLRVLETILPE